MEPPCTRLILDLMCPRRDSGEKMSELRLLAAFTRHLDSLVAAEGDLAVIATTSKTQVGEIKSRGKPWSSLHWRIHICRASKFHLPGSFSLYFLLPSAEVMKCIQEIDLSPLRRPGRLEAEASLAVPTGAERVDILRALLRRSDVLRGMTVPAADIADATPGFTGADLLLVVSRLEQEVSRPCNKISIGAFTCTVFDVLDELRIPVELCSGD